VNRVRTARRSAPANGHAAGLAAGLEQELRALEALARDMLGNLVHDPRTIAGAVDGTQDTLRRMRLTPASAVLDLLSPMVWDLAQERGKEVELVTRGAGLEVDRKILQAMKDPLIHLLRNAVDHGIEPPEARAKAGKPPRGRVAVSIASLEGGRIEIRVDDDGSGIDPARVRAAARRTHLLTAEQTEALTDAAALDLVFLSGLSTSPIITDLSGHGLGLAIIKQQVDRLGGRIRLETRTGLGTTVRMILPATIATFRGLLVRAGARPFLLPTESVERVLRIAPDAVQSVEGREAIRWDAHPLVLDRLSRLLGLAQGDDQPEVGGAQPCVVVTAGEAAVSPLR